VSIVGARYLLFTPPFDDATDAVKDAHTVFVGAENQASQYANRLYYQSVHVFFLICS
jgi:hypothetical protein